MKNFQFKLSQALPPPLEVYSIKDLPEEVVQLILRAEKELGLDVLERVYAISPTAEIKENVRAAILYMRKAIALMAIELYEVKQQPAYEKQVKLYKKSVTITNKIIKQCQENSKK